MYLFAREFFINIVHVSNYSFLQCDPNCAKGNQDFQDTGEHTPYLLSHTFTGTNADTMRQIVGTFMDEHLEDAYKLAKPWLDRKKTTFGDYRKFIKKKYSKFDELALMFFALGCKSHICVIFQDDTMWTMCESGSKDDCDILLLYRGNLFSDEVEEVDGGETGKEEDLVPTKEDYKNKKEDMELETEGMEEGEIEQDIDIERVDKEEEERTETITEEKEKKSKDEITKKPQLEGVGKKTMVGHSPKMSYQYHSTLALGRLEKKNRMKYRKR